MIFKTFLFQKQGTSISIVLIWYDILDITELLILSGFHALTLATAKEDATES